MGASATFRWFRKLSLSGPTLWVKAAAGAQMNARAARRRYGWRALTPARGRGSAVNEIHCPPWPLQSGVAFHRP